MYQVCIKGNLYYVYYSAPGARIVKMNTLFFMLSVNGYPIPPPSADSMATSHPSLSLFSTVQYMHSMGRGGLCLYSLRSRANADDIKPWDSLLILIFMHSIFCSRCCFCYSTYNFKFPCSSRNLFVAFIPPPPPMRLRVARVVFETLSLS